MLSDGKTMSGGGQASRRLRRRANRRRIRAGTSSDEVESILVVRLSAIGDVINTLPAVQMLRQAYPHAHMAWLAEPEVKPLLEAFPAVDEIITFPRKRWAQALKNPLKLPFLAREVISYVLNLRQRCFDIVFDFQGNAKSGINTFISGSKTRYGYDRSDCQELNFLFTNSRYLLPEKRLNTLQKCVGLIRHAGVRAALPARRIEFRIKQELCQKITAQLKHLVGVTSGYAVFHPGTSQFGSFKRWPLQNYAELCREVRRRLHIPVLLTWGPGEKELVQKVCQLSDGQAVVAMETPSLCDLAEVLRRAALFVGSDSGPTHLASILGVPCVALFGPKDPAINGPVGERSIVVRKNLPCSPCNKRTCKYPDCMKLITVSEVLSAAEQVFLKRELSRQEPVTVLKAR